MDYMVFNRSSRFVSTNILEEKSRRLISRLRSFFVGSGLAILMIRDGAFKLFL